MARVGWFFAGVAVLAGAPASATTYPASGTYAASIYVSSTTGDCLDHQGTSYAGVLNYSGLDNAHAGLRIPLGYDGEVSVQTLTAKAGLGTLTPSGNFIWKISSGSGEQTVSGTWSATFTVVDTVSFVAAMTEKYNNNACTEALSVSFTRVGNHQN